MVSKTNFFLFFLLLSFTAISSSNYFNIVYHFFSKLKNYFHRFVYLIFLIWTFYFIKEKVIRIYKIHLSSERYFWREFFNCWNRRIWGRYMTVEYFLDTSKLTVFDVFKTKENETEFDVFKTKENGLIFACENYGFLFWF